jgi:hypothetical protein
VSAAPCWLQTHGLLEMHDKLVPVRLHPVLNACSGPLTRCHLIPRQLMRREIKDRHELDAAVADLRGWVPGCLRHHDLLDRARRLRIPAENLPDTLWELAAELGDPFTFWLEREYGLREVAA